MNYYYPKPNLYYRSFILGHYYRLGKTIFQFIKVTNKGFNLLNIKTHSCLFRQHIYSRLWCNKQIPTDIDIVELCLIPTRYTFNEVHDISKIMKELNHEIKKSV